MSAVSGAGASDGGADLRRDSNPPATRVATGPRRIIVCGGRNWEDSVAIRRALLPYWNAGPVTVVCGGARGADRLAAREARVLGCEVEEYPADWDRFGKAAGFIRNQEMVDSGADLVIALPGGNGTAHCVQCAKRAGIEVVRVTSDRASTVPQRTPTQGHTNQPSNSDNAS